MEKSHYCFGKKINKNDLFIKFSVRINNHWEFMSGQIVTKKKTDPTTVFIIIFSVVLGGVVIYEIYRRNKIAKEKEENQAKFDSDLKAARKYLGKNTKLNDPALTSGA